MRDFPIEYNQFEYSHSIHELDSNENSYKYIMRHVKFQVGINSHEIYPSISLLIHGVFERNKFYFLLGEWGLAPF